MKKPKLKSEFLKELFPQTSEKTSRRWLGYEIEHNSELKAALTAVGYSRNTKLLTFKMQEILLDFLIR